VCTYLGLKSARQRGMPTLCPKRRKSGGWIEFLKDAFIGFPVEKLIFLNGVRSSMQGRPY